MLGEQPTDTQFLNAEDDPTCSRRWQEEQTDRLIAWELLRIYMGRGCGGMSKPQLLDKIAAPSSLWYGMIGKIRREHKDND